MDKDFDNETDFSEDNTEIPLSPNIHNDILNKSQMIFMPFLEDVLNEDEEVLKKRDR
jgi:hypothetical protein